MSMHKCPKCGELYSDTYKTCPFCEEEEALAEGRQLKHRSGGRRVAKKKEPSAVGPVMIIAVILLAVILIYLCFGDRIGAMLGGTDVPASSSEESSSPPSISEEDLLNPDVTAPVVGDDEEDGSSSATGNTGDLTLKDVESLPETLVLSNPDFTLFKKGETTTPFPEKYRVMFEGIPCWPKLPALFKPLKANGVNVTAVVYAPAFGFVYNGLDEMARAYYKAPNSVCIEQGVAWREGICRDNKVDGVLVHYNRSCKPWSGYMAEMQRRFTKDLGIPCAGFDGDQADPRNFNAAQYETRVQGLVEAMEANMQEKEAK